MKKIRVCSKDSCSSEINFLQIGVGRNVLQKGIGAVLQVNFAAVVFQTVAHDEVFDFEHHVVAAYLVEYFLGDVHIGTFVFDDHQRLQTFLTIDHCVATATHAVERHSHFVGHERRGVALLLDEEMHKMLTHPLLWGEGDELAAKHILYLHHPVHFLDVCLERRQIQWLHLGVFGNKGKDF